MTLKHRNILIMSTYRLAGYRVSRRQRFCCVAVWSSSLARHADHTSRKNCSGNPNCLFGLGERSKSGIWGKDPSFLRAAGPDLVTQRRDYTVVPSGLLNLGATCYVNVLLQCLYWNLTFRNALFRFKPAESSTSPSDVAVDAAVIALQRIFAQLQYGNRTYCSIIGFVEALSLPRSVQQDAEEFHKMLLMMLSERFRVCGVPDLSDIVPRTFSGKMLYETKCAACPDHVARSQSEEYYEIVRALVFACVLSFLPISPHSSCAFAHALCAEIKFKRGW